jgi:BirA family transcriptional regulator, biotin operon repressor / biotin---[acetyl-CoA-carboxylase] ligase
MTTRLEILRLLADGAFHSGTDMGRQLGISRAAVCKGIQGLADSGLAIERVSGRGYCLETPTDLLDEEKLAGHLVRQGVSLRGQLTLLEETESTNQYLMARGDLLVSGATCLAEAQPAGRGRRGRTWVATPFHNLMLSMAWRFQGGPALVSGLSLAAGVAAVRALEEYGVAGVGLKWPNDVLWEGRKLAGLLVDIQGEAAGPSLVVLGIGVNGYLSRNDASRVDQPWADITRITGRPVDRNRLAALLIGHLYRMFEVFSSAGLAAFRAAWQERHLHHGKAVRLIVGDQEFHGTVEGIDEIGALLVRDARGNRRVFHSGEVSLRVT